MRYLLMNSHTERRDKFTSFRQILSKEMITVGLSYVHNTCRALKP